MTTDPNEPNHVVDIDKTASELSKYIDINESEIYKIYKMVRKKKNFKLNLVLQVRDITYETKKKSKS